MMEWASVSSRAISAIGYDKDMSVLGIKFTSGKTYSYPGVPKSVHEEFLHASSHGQYFNQFIKDKYSFN